MTIALGAVLFAWTALIGVAYLARRVAGLRRPSASFAVIACYLCLATAAVLTLGAGWQGWAGAAGMLLPVAVALVMIQFG